MWPRGRVVKAFASRIDARNPGLNLTTAIGPAEACNRLTQPVTFSGMANRVPASAGLKAATSPLSQVKLCDPI